MVLHLLFTASASWVAFYKQGFLCTLYLSGDLHKAGCEIESMWLVGSQNNELSCSFRLLSLYGPMALALRPYGPIFLFQELSEMALFSVCKLIRVEGIVLPSSLFNF